MREILFRGFHPFKDGEEKIFYNNKWVKGEWVYGDVMYDRDLNTAFVSGYDYYTNGEGLQRDFFQHDVIIETVGQYTGLDDKNGRKIFEGDILKYTFGAPAVVEFDRENAKFFTYCAKDEKRIPYVSREPNAEVIGNIHSNPKLLEQEV